MCALSEKNPCVMTYLTETPCQTALLFLMHFTHHQNKCHKMLPISEIFLHQIRTLAHLTLCHKKEPDRIATVQKRQGK